MSWLRVDIWSDIACPWCYVGKRRFEQALQGFEQRERVKVTWRSFELDPHAPPVFDASSSYAERLAKKYGTSTEQAQSMISRMTTTAAADGLDLRFDLVRAGNTFAAHQLLHLAATVGLQDALKERLFRAYFSEGKAIGDHQVLVGLAREVGLDEERANATLSTDAYAAEVRADEEQARALGIRGVPFFVLGERLGVSGAQRADVLLAALTRAWQEAAAPAIEEGAVCGPEGCA